MEQERKEELQGLNQEAINEIFDTCAFDTIVEGYLISVLEEIGEEPGRIKEALEHLQIMFNDLGADEVLAIREGFIHE